MESSANTTNVIGLSAGVGKSLLTGDMAATYLGLTKRTLERWRVNGSGPKFVKVGKKILYRPSDLEAWMTTRTFANTAESRLSLKA